MNGNIPAIVVVGYNRPYSLKRVLHSIASATYPATEDVTLVISLDNSGSDACKKVAEGFSWQHGDVQIITHEERLGLRKHIVSCGDLTATYGAVIILEDDLYVSREFYAYALAAKAFYESEREIAGIALYSYDVCEQTHRRFIPINDGFDNYFIQMAASSGQMWTKGQWDGFREWYRENAAEGVTLEHNIPGHVVAWPETSWKKYYIRYLVETEKYFVYPRVAVVTNFGDIGSHSRKRCFWDQTPLAIGIQKPRFSRLDQSISRYDVFFEPEAAVLKRINPALEQYEFECDLFGLKAPQENTKPYLLSARPCKNPVMSFGLELIPESANIALDIRGDFFHLGLLSDFERASLEKDIDAMMNLHKIEPNVLRFGVYAKKISAVPVRSYRRILQLWESLKG